MDLGLKGKVAMVVAASQGLGKAVALALAREGARVAICARTEATLQQAAHEIRAETGADVLSYAANVADSRQVQSFAAEVRARFGHIDICVANAGGPPSKPFFETTPEDWRSAVDLNLLSTVTLAREVLPGMCAQQWGRFVAITSVAVKQPIDGLILSNSVRAAVAGLTKTLANECGPYNVLVNNVCPGYTATERLRSLIGKDTAAQERLAAQIPLKRFGKPEEFAAVVAFLCSEQASYVSGVTLAVDGGLVRGLM
ncbi:MAG: SDR family oxidoreductase [Acidobacteriota bacterium]|nr:SDR family oxidoreductase [Acidobacteriota bacterium]